MLTRALAGVLLAVVAVVATGVSYALAAPGGLYVGALAAGLIGSVLPIIAAARVAAVVAEG